MNKLNELVKETTTPVAPQESKTIPQEENYDLEGLKSDFPTAGELELFVYNETKVKLNLKGRSNELKYKVALDVLNGKEVDSKFYTEKDPRLDEKDLVPVDELKPIPDRDATLPPQSEIQHFFHHFNMKHPDATMRAQDAKVITVFRKYTNGAISYEILGPLEQHAQGEKMDKFGRSRPEKLVWMDPRTGEQTVRRQDGSYTKIGQALVTYCKSQEGGNLWDNWIDKSFVGLTQGAIDNPWDV
jgi:hypothetical protein